MCLSGHFHHVNIPFASESTTVKSCHFSLTGCVTWTSSFMQQTFISVNSVRNTGLGARDMNSRWSRNTPSLASQSLASHQSSGMQTFLLTWTLLVLVHYYNPLRSLCNLIPPWFPDEKNQVIFKNWMFPEIWILWVSLVICNWWECSQVLVGVKGKTYCPDKAKVTKYLWLRLLHTHTPYTPNKYNLFIGR